MKKIALLLFPVLIMAACFTAKVAAPPAQADVDRVATRYPGYTLEDLNRGKGLYEQNCGNCHALKRPASEPVHEWEKEVPKMVIKANKKFGNKIDKAAEEDILRYVVTMCQAKK